eukprot:TRINITY_DN13682_c1_g1_i1.p1 TRINITY_DN13682_c1_g1~~TRINITY_DN13682_c1_g1_i1.p1  ORF type:complete len:782 (-),score=272.40 TRINITY_DN13682_c1_g1_i1:93-2438(-)
MVRALHVSVSATVAAVASATVSSMGESSAALSRQNALEQSWSQELSVETKGKSPVKRVVGLLTKMKSELEAEADKEGEMYDKMVCWCKTNKKEKTAAVAKAETTIKELESEIEGRSASFGELSTNIEAMKKQIEEDTTALRQATGIREKEAGEFRGEETDLVQAITNLKNAIGILSKHHSSLLQLDASALSGMQVVLRDVALKHAMLSAKSPRMKRSSFMSLASSVREVQGATKEEESLRRLVLGALEGTEESFDGASLPLKFAEKVLTRLSAAQTSASSFLQASSLSEKQPLSNSYNSRSDGIYGIMNQMLEDFESELSSSQQQELKAAEDHKALAAAKNEQLTVGKAKLDEMETELAENGKGFSDAKENLDLTRKQRAADVEFLRNLKLTCNDLDSQWEERSRTRSMETKAIAETLVILTEDDNREQLAKSSAPSFVQLGEQVSGRSLRARAAAVLRGDAASPTFDASDLLAAWDRRGAASSTSAPRARLTALASMVQLDSFTKVKAMMDKLVADMKEEQAEEVKFKSYCQKEFRENEKAVHAKSNEKKDLAAKMEQLETLIGKLGGEIKDHEAEITSTKTEVKRASQTREEENAAFQMTVADQRAMQAILKKALARLEDFYKKGPGAEALLQRAQQTPPVQFNKYKANAGSAPVMGLLEQIIGDSSSLEKEAIKDEYTAQADYEKFVKDSNAMIKQLSEAVTEKTKAIASSREEQTTARSSHESAVGELESLAAYEADLHRQCDFVLANFDIRQQARLQEMESIAKAKAILSGSAEQA